MMKPPGNASPLTETAPLRLTLFGLPQITVTHEGRRPEAYPLPGDDWVLLLVYLAYFGERDSQGGIVERAKIESSWRDARAKDPRGTNEYFGYSAAGAVRNATSEMRRYIARLFEGTTVEGADIVETAGKGLLRLNRQIISTDIADFFDNLRTARQADLPDEASLARERLAAAQHLFEEGEFLPGFEHRFGRYEILENGQGLESWVLDARRLLQTKQNQTAERLVKLAPFLLLPSYENAFVPRKELSATIREWLFEEGGSGSRLSALVLHGGYGAGKTRLAIETVRSLTIREALGLYPEGIAFLPLDSYFTQPGSATETAFLQAVAQRLRAPDGIQNSLTSHNASDFFRWIGSKPKRLLILDNGESLYSDITAKALTRLLHATDGRLRCLLTSRAAWPGLRHLTVDGMPMPVHPDDDFETYAGSRLYLERARQRDPNYVVPDPTLLIAAFEQTDSQPLNIEILAGHAWDKGADGLRALVEQRQSTLRALQGPDPPESDDLTFSSSSLAARRHRSAAASIFWSIDRLQLDEREKFIRLAVFPYDWGTAAAVAICGVTEEDLRTWRDLYLATYDRDRDRWLLRPRIREVVQDLLTETKDWHVVHEKHRDFYLSIAEEASVQLNTSAIRIAQKIFEQEMPNFRSSLAFGMGRADFQDGQVALKMSVALRIFLLMRGRTQEAVEIIRLSLGHKGAIKTNKSRIDALCSATVTLSNRLCNPSLATDLVKELEDNLYSLNDPDRANVLHAIANYHVWSGHYECARRTLKEAEDIYKETGNDTGLCQVYNIYCCNEAFRGNLISDKEQLRTCLNEQYMWVTRSRVIADRLFNTTQLAIALSNEGQIASEIGLFSSSLTAIHRGIRLAYENELVLQTVWFFNVSGHYCLRCGQHKSAVRLWSYRKIYGQIFGVDLEQAIVECLSVCHKVLGESVYQREAEIGSAWSLEQAVEYVMGLPPPPPDRTDSASAVTKKDG